MAKLSDYEFPPLSGDVTLFKDDVLDLVNNGKFQFKLLTTTPTQRGNPCEVVFVLNGTASAMYVQMVTNSTVWSKVATFTASS